MHCNNFPTVNSPWVMGNFKFVGQIHLMGDCSTPSTLYEQVLHQIFERFSYNFRRLDMFRYLKRKRKKAFVHFSYQFTTTVPLLGCCVRGEYERVYGSIAPHQSWFVPLFWQFLHFILFSIFKRSQTHTFQTVLAVSLHTKAVWQTFHPNLYFMNEWTCMLTCFLNVTSGVSDQPYYSHGHKMAGINLMRKEEQWFYSKLSYQETSRCTRKSITCPPSQDQWGFKMVRKNKVLKNYSEKCWIIHLKLSFPISK